MTTGTAAPKKRMTADEFYDWVHLPENANKWFELVRGEVIELPPPLKRHGAVCMNVGWVLGSYVRQRGKGYLTGNDSGVILERDPDTVRGPDVALYEDARAFAELHPKYGEVPPVLAVEVLSPNDRADRVTRKIMDYLRNGVGLVWLIDPEARTVTVYLPDRAPCLVEEGQELDGGEALPGFRCRVAEFFLLPGEQAGPQPGPKPAPPRKRRR
jgi:Uma2 family endonuclease